MIYPVGAGGPVTYALATPTEFSRFLSIVNVEAQGMTTRSNTRSNTSVALQNGNILPTLELLAHAGFDNSLISGFGDAASEFDGGR